MSAQEPISSSHTSILYRFYPSVTSKSPSHADILHLSHSIYPGVTYTDVEKVEIQQWLTTADRLTAHREDQAKHAERLGALNIHLSSRTTILGCKPSIADIVLYDRLAPAVKSWSSQERTGEHGYHHIVRYIDFVQNASMFALSIKDSDRVTINPNEVLFAHKPLDPKEEKERKKKEKALASSSNGDKQSTMVVGRTKPEETPKSIIAGAVETILDSQVTKTIISAVSSSQPQSHSKKEQKERAPKARKCIPKETPLSPCLIDLRVGHILRAINHPNADSLYVSTIACGDPEGTENTSIDPSSGQVVRTVCSGLNGLIPLSEMQNRKVVAVCNLKPVTMRGIKSAAMVLAASPRLTDGVVNNHAGPVELVTPPAEAKVGERVFFEGWDGEPEGVLNPKKKVWETLQPGFTTTEDMEVGFEKGVVESLKEEAGRPALGKLRVASGGECKVTSLKGAVVR